MLASDGTNNEGLHKKNLAPNVEIYETHRKVYLSIEDSNKNTKIENRKKKTSQLIWGYFSFSLSLFFLPYSISIPNSTK